MARAIPGSRRPLVPRHAAHEGFPRSSRPCRERRRGRQGSRQAPSRAAHAGPAPGSADRGLHRAADRHGGVRVPARAAVARRVVPFRARPADRAARGAGHLVPHDRQRHPEGRCGHRRRARRRRGRRLRPVQLVGARPAHRGHPRARHRTAASRRDPGSTDQRHADLLGRLARGRDQPHHRDADRRRRGTGRRPAVRSAAGAARQERGRRPEPPDGRPARPDGGRAGRDARPAARGGVAGPDPGAARRDRAGGRRPGPGRGERPAEPQEAEVRRPGRGPARGRRHAGACCDGYAGAGSFGGRQRADRQRPQPGQGSGDPRPAGGRDRRAFRRGPGLRPAAGGRPGIWRVCRVRARADHRGAGRSSRGGPAAAGPAR